MISALPIRITDCRRQPGGYFGVDANDLSLSQIADCARSRTHRPTTILISIRRMPLREEIKILGDMKDMGFITEKNIAGA